MPSALKSINIWREMRPGVLRRFALAAFLTFGALGLVSILIESSIRYFPWTFVVVQTLAWGGMAATIVLVGRRRWWATVLAIIFWVGVMTFNHSGLSFVFSDTEGMRVRLGGGLETVRGGSPNSHSSIPTQAQLDAIYVQRGIMGVAIILFLSTGYWLFLSVIRNEIRHRAWFETEVRIAQDIQQSLLPERSVQTPSCSIAGAALPASEVGGDYYDVIELSDGKIALVIADVTGHGVGAGILSAMTKSALRLQLDHASDPVSVLKYLNRVLFDVSNQKTFVTFAYALINPAESTIAVATAGHPPILHRSATTGKMSSIRSRNPALGIRRDLLFSPAETIQYAPGDLLLMYTDGLLEVTGAKGEQFGEETLERLFLQASGTPDQILTILLSEVRKFARREEAYEDDITAVCVQMNRSV